MTPLLVALGAAVGAPLRYLVDRAVRSRLGSFFPWGTLAVNVAGSLVLGMLAGGADAAAVPDGVVALLGTGLCGALTTYSTFGAETIRLVEEKVGRAAVLNVAASVGAGVAAAFAGVALGRLLWA